MDYLSLNSYLIPFKIIRMYINDTPCINNKHSIKYNKNINSSRRERERERERAGKKILWMSSRFEYKKCVLCESLQLCWVLQSTGTSLQYHKNMTIVWFAPTNKCIYKNWSVLSTSALI